jgi:hypothetical protein
MPAPVLWSNLGAPANNFRDCRISLPRALFAIDAAVGQHFGSGGAKSPGDIEKTAALPVLRLDDPNIRIETDLAGEFLFGFDRIDPGVGMEPREKPVLAILHFAPRRRSEQCGETIQPVDLDKNRAGFRSAPAAQHGKGAFTRAASEIGRHPKIGA